MVTSTPLSTRYVSAISPDPGFHLDSYCDRIHIYVCAFRVPEETTIMTSCLAQGMLEILCLNAQCYFGCVVQVMAQNTYCEQEVSISAVIYPMMPQHTAAPAEVLNIRNRAPSRFSAKLESFEFCSPSGHPTPSTAHISVHGALRRKSDVRNQTF